MNTRISILSCIWAATLVGSFLIGRQWQTNPPPISSTYPAGAMSAKAAQDRNQEKPKSPVVTGGAVEALEGGDGETATNYYSNTTIPVAERMTEILAMEDAQLKMKNFLALLDTIREPEEYQKALDALMDGFEPRGRGRELSMLMSAWAKRDPQGAIEYAGKGNDWTNRWAASTAAKVWAAKSPDEAIAFAKTNQENFKDEDGANWLVGGIISGIVKKDLDKAVSLAESQPRSRARGDMMDKLVDGYFSQRGTEAAQKWVEAMPDGAFKDGVARKVAWNLTEKDPAASAGWIAALPEGGGKYNAINDLMNRWAEKDPNAAGTWLQNYPPSEKTDEPRQTFAWTIREKDPESALAWAGTIVNEERRQKMLIEIARDWQKREPEAARQFLQQNSWSPELKEKVMGRSGG